MRKNNGVALKALNDCRLYTFVDSAYLHGRDPIQVAEQLCEGGSDLIPYHSKLPKRRASR